MTNKFVDVIVVSYSADALYGIYNALPMNELLSEYTVCINALDSFLESDFLVYSPVREYLDSIIQIMRIVIADRCCAFMTGVGSPPAMAAAAEPPVTG